MKFYDEVVNFLRQHASKQGNVLPAVRRKPSRTNQLYEALSSGQLHSDEEAADYFFGEWGRNYRQLRGRFVKDIVTSVLMIDWSTVGDERYQRIYYSVIREMAVAKILSGKSLAQTSLFFVKRCYDKAKEIGLYDILEESLYFLRMHYGTRVKKEKEFLQYDKEYQKVLQVRDLERTAEKYYIQMVLHNKNHGSNVEVCRSNYEEYFQELHPYLDNCDSLKFQLFSRLIRLNIDSLGLDYQSMLAHCSDDVNFYLDHRVLHSSALNIFLVQKTTACIRLGEYEEGLSTIRQSLKITDNINVNWFAVKHNEFFLYMQSGQYDRAYRVYQQVIRNRKYSKLLNPFKEPWLIGEAYLYYLIEAGVLEMERKPKAYRVGRFLNAVPEYSKDKRVQNIPILIIQVLFMLLRKRTDEAIDRIESIEKYCARHLRYNEAVRSNAFIMMLLQIPKASFSKLGVERRIQKYSNKLQEVKIHQSGKAFDLELIPYERLWGYAVSSLK